MSVRFATIVSVLGWIWMVVWLAIAVALFSLAGGSSDAVRAAGGSVATGLGGFGMAWALARTIGRSARRR